MTAGNKCPRCGGSMFRYENIAPPEAGLYCLQCGNRIDSNPFPPAPLVGGPTNHMPGLSGRTHKKWERNSPGN